MQELVNAPVLADEIAEIEKIVRLQDKWRLEKTINLIASENVMSLRARRLLNSDFTHRYAEGHPGKRYYEGTKYIDEIEAKIRTLIRQLFRCKHAEVRTISGTNANGVVYNALLSHDDPVIVNRVKVGGHISHQAFGAIGRHTKNIQFYPLAKNGYSIDVNKTKDLINEIKPRLIILGKSLILFPEPVKELKSVCIENDTTIIFDGAHVLGLIAGDTFQDPLAEGADFLLGSTHKTFFGPQRGVILSNTDEKSWEKIDKAAFPGAVSNHHLHTLPPLLVSTIEMIKFGNDYSRQVVKNAQALAQNLDKLGLDVQCKELGYTESHQVAVDVSKYGGGKNAAATLTKNDIIANCNLLPFDTQGPLNPSGIRLGSQELTRIGMGEQEMGEVARLVKECIVDGKDVKDQVNNLKNKFTAVKYSFDHA